MFRKPVSVSDTYAPYLVSVPIVGGGVNPCPFVPFNHLFLREGRTCINLANSRGWSQSLPVCTLQSSLPEGGKDMYKSSQTHPLFDQLTSFQILMDPPMISPTPGISRSTWGEEGAGNQTSYKSFLGHCLNKCTCTHTEGSLCSVAMGV